MSQSDLFTDAAPQFPGLDWSERWLRWWFHEVADDSERARYLDMLPEFKLLHGHDDRKCLACANRARRVVVRKRLANGGCE